MVLGGYFDMEGVEEQGTASMLTPEFLAWVAGQVKVPSTVQKMHKVEVCGFEFSKGHPGGDSLSEGRSMACYGVLPSPSLNITSKQQVVLSVVYMRSLRACIQGTADNGWACWAL